ncbi:Chaoptin [Halotydeus destructor]|nr:Chaoptin [Halotydeus destructor]
MKMLFMMNVKSSKCPIRKLWTLNTVTALAILLNIAATVQSDPLDPPCFFNPLCTCSKPHPDLGKVTCSSVQLPVVPVSLNSSSVYILILRSNGLRAIEHRSFFGTGLSRLEITDNKITGLSGQSLTGLERTLRELVLSSNLIENIPRSAMVKLTRLRELNLNSNSIRTVSGDLDFPSSLRTSLKVLILSNNDISTLEPLAFRNLLSLEHLDLSGNNIKMVHEWAFLPETRPPDGHAYVRVETMTSLMQLNMADNQLTKIPFQAIQNLTGLRVLDLGSNLITATDSMISGIKLTLNQLYLDHNFIGELLEGSFRNFGHLDKLSLAYNPIGKISDATFTGVRLGALDLTGCLIDHVAPATWAGMERQLQEVDLSWNRLLPSFPGSSDVIFYNDSFSNLETISKLTLNNNAGMVRLSPLSLLSSQYSLNELSLKVTSGKGQPFSPVKFEMHFPNIRRLSLNRLGSGSRLTRTDLLGFGDYNLEDLDLSGAGLDELTGDAFESTPSLKRLNLANNGIRRLELTTFKPLGRSLLELNLNGGLSSRTLPCAYLLEPLTALRVLSLMNSGIEQFSSNLCFGPLRHVQVLMLDYNAIKFIDRETFSSNFDLRRLSLSFNKLATIFEGTFVDFEHLEHLDLSYNVISRLRQGSFSNLPFLRVLELQSNELETVDLEAFAYLPRLEHLNLSNNRLRTFSMKYFDQVGTLSTFSLNVRANQIGSANSSNGHSEALTSGYPETISVEQLDLSSNDLVHFDSELFESIRNSLTKLNLSNNKQVNITSSTLSRFKNVQKIDLSQNFIEFLSPEAFKEDFSLQVLDLSSNRITELFSDVFRDNVNLRVLDISNNKLITLADNVFRLNHQLEIVNLDDNKLTCLPTSALRHVSSTIRILSCAHNRIRFLRLEDVQLVSFNRLLELDVSDNQIKTIPENFFNDFTQLKRLSISSNPIRVVSDSLFDGLSGSLDELFMSNTELRAIPMINLPKLKRLDVSFNLINGPNSISLSNITALEHLDLTSNTLTIVPNNLWPHLNRLRSLSLSHNPIASLENDSFVGLDHLETLSMVNLTRLTTLAPGTFKPLGSLRFLETSVYPQARPFPVIQGGPTVTEKQILIFKLLQDIRSLRDLVLITNGTELNVPGLLSPKVNRLTIKGLPRKAMASAATSELTKRSPGRVFNLAITGTNISSFNPSLFTSTLNLRQPTSINLDLRDNLLSSMPDVMGHVTKNRHLDLNGLQLSGNPINCDCKLAWIRDWIKQMKMATVPFTSDLLRQPRTQSNRQNGTGSSLTNSPDTGTGSDVTPDQLLDKIMGQVESIVCRKSGRSLLDLFRKELRECKRNASLGSISGLLFTPLTMFTLLTIVQITFFKAMTL